MRNWRYGGILGQRGCGRRRQRVCDSTQSGPLDGIAVALLDLAKQAIEIVHVEIINPVEMDMPRHILAYMRLDRQDSASVENLERAVWCRRCLEIGADVQQPWRYALRK